MGRWGWRRLLAVFVSVWVVGCSATHDNAPTMPPTILPRVTLTVRVPITVTPQGVLILPTPLPQRPTTATPVIYTAQPGDTLLSIARAFGVPVETLRDANGGIDPQSLQIGQHVLIPQPLFDAAGAPVLPTQTPLPLTLSPPTCYDSATTSLICLGLVHNDRREPVGRVTVIVQALDREGRVLAMGQAGVEQTVIRAGESAPYRVLLPVDLQAVGGTIAWLQSADAAHTGNLAAVAVEGAQASWQGDRYVLSVILRNIETDPVQVQRAVLTLLNTEGQVTGYRVAQVNHVLPPGGELPLTVDVLPHVDQKAVIHRLYVEAVSQPTPAG